MTRSVYCFDGGRSQYKIMRGDGQALTIPAGVVEIAEATYNEIMARRDRERPDVVCIRGKYFIVGEHARYYGVLSNQNTAQRYAWDNIGVACMSSILRYGMRSQTIDLVVSYPPLDFNYRDRLRSSLMDEWEVESDGKVVTVDVTRVEYEDEPVCLMRNLQFTQEGKYSQRSPVAGRVLIFDGGGETADIAGTDNEGRLVEALLGSRHIGINHYITTFEAAIRAKYGDFFSEVAEIDRVAMQEAFATGWFMGGGEKLDVHAESEQQKQSYLNRVIQFVQEKTGGVRNFDMIIVGGGAAGLFQYELSQALGHSKIVFAHDDIETIHLAGVSGMLREYRFWRSQGWD